LPSVLDFRILGPLEVTEDGESLDLGCERQRAFLAVLLLEPGRVVTSERLMEMLWQGRNRPVTAAESVRRCAIELQEILGPEILEARPEGYRVQLRPGQLDVDRFRVLIESAERGSLSARSEKLRHALALWRGPVLADLAGWEFAQPAIAELERLRREAEARLER
jgi:DNA-binding SARP family transcriptional activator